MYYARKEKWQTTSDGMELQNQDKIRTVGQMETCKYFGILEADLIKKVKMKYRSKK